MSENSTHRRAGPESGSPSCPNRILDRKIERRALPTSFSSNLGKRVLSPARKASDGSVRSMVSLFERTAAASNNAKPTRPRLASRESGKASVSGQKEGAQSGRESNESDKQAATFPQDPKDEKAQLASTTTTTPSMFPSPQVGYQIEDYSLTLLKHKSYFNNRPLARCLDDVLEDDAKTKVQRVRSKRETGKELTTTNKEHKRDESGQGSKENTTVAESPAEQPDGLMSGLPTCPKTSESTKSTPEIEREVRDPAEVKRFWSNVRTQLWVDDIETDEEESKPMEQGNREDGSVDEHEDHTMEPSASLASIPSTCSPVSQLECPPPPMPTRPPPPIPVTPRGRSCSAASSQGNQYSTTSSLELFPDAAADYPAWDEPPPTPCVGLGIITPNRLDNAELLSDEEPELPALPQPGRPLPIPPRRPSHSRYPSSSSGPWTRPPTWRPPSSLTSSSPPPVPALPISIPTPPATNHHHHHRNPRRRANHVRNRHQPQSSCSTTSMSVSIPSSAATVTDMSSGNRSIHSSRRTPAPSTSSIATRSTRADSGSTDVSAVPRAPPPAPRLRRLTTEEKLSEIDAFLFSPEGVGGGGWI